MVFLILGGCPFWLNCLSGSSVHHEACSFVLFGKYTSLLDFSFLGKFISSGTKFDVAPESMTNFIAHHLSMRRVHLLVFVDTSGCCAAVTVLIWSALSSSSILLSSGAQ